MTELEKQFTIGSFSIILLWDLQSIELNLTEDKQQSIISERMPDVYLLCL